MLVRITLSVIISLTISSYSLATTYYVGNDGDDSNNGTSPSTPWQNLSKACTTTVISPGDTIFIMGGTYSEQWGTSFYEGALDPPRTMYNGPLHITYEGSEGNEIVYKAYPDSARPVIDGSDYTSIACCLYGASYIVLDGLEFTKSFKGGICLHQQAHHNVIKNCVSHNNHCPAEDDDHNGGGIFFWWGPNNVMEYNTIQACTLYNNTSTGFGNASGIHGYNTNRCIIENNVIYGHQVDIYYGNGIKFKEGDTLRVDFTRHDSLIIRNNIIYGNGIGIIASGYYAEIYKNVIYDCETGISQVANRGEASGFEIYNNTIYNGGDGIRFKISAGGNIYTSNVWNNIVVDCHGGGGWYNWATNWYAFTPDFYDLYSDYNCYWNSDGWDSLFAIGPYLGETEYTLAQWQALWADSTYQNDEHTINQYPMFVDTTAAGGYNLRLLSGSPCATGGEGGDYLPYMGAYPPGSDSTPPGTIEDLNAIPGNNHGEIILTWTAPGDDGFVGLADHYVIKYSAGPISESSWYSDSTVSNPAAPLVPGDSTYFTIDSLVEGQIYFVAIKTYDEVGNGSDISNVPDTFACGIMVPTQISTEIDSTNSSVTVVCSAVDSYMSIYYEFALDTLDYFPNPRIEIDLTADSVASAIFGDLSYEIGYFWRCRAVASDLSDSSDGSPAIGFNMLRGVAQLSDEDCIYPTAGQVVQTSRPVFSVRYVPGIANIYFQVDDNPQFGSPVESGLMSTTQNSSTEWQIAQPLEQGITYYWRVSSNNIIWTSHISFSAVLDIHPYPNPFRASEGHTSITFTNLPQNSSIIISTISGGIVLREDNIGPVDWVWDVKNDRGNDLAPGVYLYMIDFPSGSSNGKVVVIR